VQSNALRVQVKTQGGMPGSSARPGHRAWPPGPCVARPWLGFGRGRWADRKWNRSAL